MSDSAASGHYFDDDLVPGLKDKFDNYHELAKRWWIISPGGH